MSLDQPMSSSAEEGRWLTRTLFAYLAVVLILAPGIAGTGGTGGDTNDDAQMVADAMRAERAVIAAYNDKKWNQLRALYMEDALVPPPNHEPVRGRDAIT